MEAPLRPSLAGAVAVWAAGWTLGAIVWACALIVTDIKVPAAAVVTALLVGLCAFAFPNYVAARMFGGSRAALEALVWLSLFVVMWAVYAWINVPPALNINTTETMRAREEYFRNHSMPPEMWMALQAVAIYALAAGFWSGVLNGSLWGWPGRLAGAIAFSAIVLASFAAAWIVIAVAASVFLMVAPALAGATAGAGITLGRRALWAARDSAPSRV